MSDYGVQPVGYDELLQRSDIISMHAPGTKDAHHLMKEQHFRKMKKTALFVNTGRGSTVDEAAMIKALQEGWIAGAGLDVMESRADRPQQPAARHGQRDPDGARRLGLEPLRRRPQAPRRRRDGAGAGRQVAARLRQSRRCWRSPSSSAGSPSRWSAARGTRAFPLNSESQPHFPPHPEERAQRASRRVATGTVPVAILRGSLRSLLRMRFSTADSVEQSVRDAQDYCVATPSWASSGHGRACCARIRRGWQTARARPSRRRRARTSRVR